MADDDPAVLNSAAPWQVSHHNLGSLLSATGKPSEAEAEYRRAIAISQKVVDSNPAVTDFRVFLANHHTQLGNMLSNTGKPSEAEAEHRKALRIRQKLADDSPAVPRIPRRPGGQPPQSRPPA